jgi:uncharacterized membrane protein
MADLIAIGYPDETTALAAIVRNREGKLRVTTNHHAVGAGLGALMGKVEKTGIDKQFQDQVRDMLKPGTSALFLVVEKVTPDKAVEGLQQYGGTVLKSSLSREAEAELQDALHGEPATA